MPCDYKLYPSNWKTEIRPAVLERDGHKCKMCGVKNYETICRGMWEDKDGNRVEVYQNEAGQIFNANNGEHIGDSYLGDVMDNEKGRVTRVVLTVMHLDHDVTNNDLSNLAAACQWHHLRHDKEQHRENSRKTINARKRLQNLF
jgi:hypothetical protein